VADEDEQSDGWRPKAWHGRLIAVLLILGAGLHALKPSWLTLDWPTIAMIVVAIFLIIVPLSDLDVVVESIEFGKAKVLLRKRLNQLDKSVERALNEDVAIAGTGSAGVTAPTPEGEEPEAEDDDDLPEPPKVHVPRSAWGDFFDDPRNRTLFDTDMEMMLVRLGIEIEKVLFQLVGPENAKGTVRPMVWNVAVKDLTSRNIITPQIAKALLEFRDVRNRLIHPSAGSVTSAFVASAVDSGIKLLRLLTGLRDINR
jgi:hypothetical protein